MVEENNNLKISKTRLFLLAEKKLNFQLPGSPYTVVSNGALNYEATDRVRSLSQPRVRKQFLHTRPGNLVETIKSSLFSFSLNKQNI